MAKYVRKLKPEYEEKKPQPEEMSVSDLKKLCVDYDIPATGTKAELVERIRQYEADKYIKPVVYETVSGINSKTKWHFIGVHDRDEANIHKINALVQKGDAKYHHYAADYFYYETTEKIKLV